MYELIIGDRSFSSWSLRGWLMLEKFGLPYQTRMVGLYSGTMRADMAPYAPARTVPAMVTPQGHILSDSLSMAETLAEAHPDAGLWPADTGARALARNLVAEMHASFMPLRDECTNIVNFVWQGFVPSPTVQRDVARIEYLWALAHDRYGRADSPWLFGDYSLADVFYAPVACRFTAYGLATTDTSQAYVDAHLDDPAFQSWRAEAMQEVHDPFPYDLPYEKGDWPR